MNSHFTSTPEFRQEGWGPPAKWERSTVRALRESRSRDWDVVPTLAPQTSIRRNKTLGSGGDWVRQSEPRLDSESKE